MLQWIKGLEANSLLWPNNGIFADEQWNSQREQANNNGKTALCDNSNSPTMAPPDEGCVDAWGLSMHGFAASAVVVIPANGYRRACQNVGRANGS